MHEVPFATDEKACFLTATYSDENLPENGNLKKSDWVKFAKKLRHKMGPFRFLMCGEYGSRKHTERCHMHAIILNHDFIEDRVPLETTEQGHQLYTSETLSKLWPHGFVSIGNVSHDSAAYVASYIQKKFKGKPEDKRRHYNHPSRDPNYINPNTGEIGTYDQVPEFALMSRGDNSKHPLTGYGLGHAWITKYYREVYPRDEILVNGHLASPPDYYDRWYEQHFPAEMAEVKKQRLIRGAKHIENNSPERLAIRKAVFTSKAHQY